MSLYQDKQIKGFTIFLIMFALMFSIMNLTVGLSQVNHVKALFLAHDEAVASSLLEQGVSRETVAVALTNIKASGAGQKMMATIGIENRTDNSLLPFIHQYQQSMLYALIITIVLSCSGLAAGTIVFFQKRKRLYEQAGGVLTNYINGDYSCHLPQNSEGTIYQIFALVEQLATMLQSKNEAEHKAKDFLKSTISDVSHQLKTPLAALTMYQEIMEAEPDNADTIKEFSLKMGTSLKRMEQLIQSMLKITRLDAGNVLFEKRCCQLTELIALSLSELTMRAENEDKQIVMDGDPGQQLVCDPEWTSEAIGNIVKNALDHTSAGGVVHITWERTPATLRISIADNGSGIAPEDIHHIFKRFYRSKYSLDTQGVGLGLPLAKSIIEGQKGVLSVRSTPNEGSVFTISFLTEL